MSTAVDLLAGLVLSDGRRWGDAAEQWQWADAQAVLEGPRRLCYLTRPRGASKTTDLGAIAVAGLLDQLPVGSRSYAAAADRDQARLLVDAMAGLVARTPGIGGALRVDTWRVTATRTGATLDVLAADAAGAFGKLPHLIIVDEFAQWPTTPELRRFWEALFSALPKVSGSRLVILTSAGDPSHPAGKLIARARASRRWYVHEVPGPCPWISADDLEEQRAELTESQYARLHLNRWAAAEDRLVRPEDLAACVTLDGPQEPRSGTTYCIGLDVGLRHDRTAIAVTHAEQVPDSPERSRRVVLDRLVVLAGSRNQEVRLSDVEEAVAEASGRYGRAKVIGDPWQAIGLFQRLRARGVAVEEYPFTQQSTGRLGSTLYLLLRDHLLALPDDEDLVSELASVRLRETAPGVLRIDHDSGGHDDRAIALALAAHSLVSTASQPATVSGPQRTGLRVPIRGIDITRSRPRSASAFAPGRMRR